MERLDTTAVRALRLALDAQPLTEAKVAFAWRLAAGPALSRAAEVSWSDGVLSIRTRSGAWSREMNRARPVILQRIAALIGAGAVTTLRVLEDAPRA